MALLVRVLRNQISISQWVPVCSWLVPLSPTQGRWGRPLFGTSQWPQMSQSLACGGSEQIPGIHIQLSRKYHTTSKLSSAKDFPEPAEEKPSWDTMRASFQMITGWLPPSGGCSSTRNVKTLGSSNCWWNT
ncbi:ubiquinol-cytochrome c reductase complex assembly factor 1 [Phyllostomus discolor]|uniref:Ubiquinol-cytochrome c reductase complex assembly factor 1 n=1 Tax=Phyllostomus discolor TaxID=89673 RepID=A0A834DTQ4_9CHIR|nr:ubiquinol-cytochrome c reductase complex assembly factor 1 [Phyllostomus discolor]